MSDIREFLENTLTEAKRLRYSDYPIPGPSAYPQEVLESLLHVRRRYDRMEELYLTTLQLRGKLNRKRSDASSAAQDAWNTAIVSARQASIRQGDEFTSGKERAAEADLATLEYKLKQRQIEELYSEVDDVTVSLKSMLWGLDGLRQDHLTWLRTLNFQSNLET